MLTFAPSQLFGAKPVFCVEFVFMGRTHRYSTDRITLSSNEGNLDYYPNIINFDFSESADIVSTDLEANIVSMALIMEDVNLLKQLSNNVVLEGVEAEFFYILSRFDSPDQTYENRVILYKGQIEEPQFGDPSQMDNFVTFSIEAQPYDSNRLLLDQNKYIDNRFINRDIETAEGKIWPIILGITTAAPTYCIRKRSGSTAAQFMIAGHTIEDTTILIKDQRFNSISKPVLTGVDNRGNIYSYIEIAYGEGVDAPGILGSESREWWSTIEGGFPNPYGAGFLTLGGDICRWALSRSGQFVDDGAWANLSVILNRYKFSGYINDETITSWEWLQGNIIPFLPITVRMGPNGLRPVLIELWALSYVKPVYSINIGDNEECQQIGPVDTIRATSDLINEYTLSYAKTGFDQDYKSQVRVTNITSENYDIPSEYSILSVNAYGKKPAADSADYIYDDSSAEMIALNKIRSNSLPLFQLEISAPTDLGWLLVGDCIEATIDRMYMVNHKMIITSKTWAGNHWRFTILFERNPLQNK